MTTTVRIPFRLEQALACYCAETRRSKPEVIIELLEQRFATEPRQKTSHDPAMETGFIASPALDENAAPGAGSVFAPP
jgi:hypothetical protein